MFETARTRLAYGERLRRARNRVLAREQLRAAADDVRAPRTPGRGPSAPAPSSPPPARRAAAGPEHVDELTPQELQIALLLTAGQTTRETAAALFLSPKTVEYHLRHVYHKLGIHSREELARALAAQRPAAGAAPAPAPDEPRRDQRPGLPRGTSAGRPAAAPGAPPGPRRNRQAIPWLHT